MPSAETEAVRLNLFALLARLTGKKQWEGISGPDSETGVDYWFARKESTANINLDQNWLTVSVDGKMLFEGTDAEAANI
jgi:hypothetical protein